MLQHFTGGFGNIVQKDKSLSKGTHFDSDFFMLINGRKRPFFDDYYTKSHKKSQVFEDICLNNLI